MFVKIVLKFTLGKSCVSCSFDKKDRKCSTGEAPVDPGTGSLLHSYSH